MSKVLTLTVITVLCMCGQSAAQEQIQLYSTQDRSACSVADTGPGTISVYAWLTGPTPARAVRFSVPKPACWSGATWVADNIPPTSVSIGDSQGDWSVAFFAGNPVCNASFTPPVYIGEIVFSVSGTAPECCKIVATAGTSGNFQMTDCNHQEANITAGQGVVINPRPSCDCVQPLAVEPSTWGKVKAMYR